MTHVYKTATMFFALAIFVLGSAAASQAEQAGKVDNFILYLDYSPSMNLEHPIWKQNKLAMAINTAQALNQQINDYGETMAVYRFNGFKQFMPQTPYNKMALQGVLANAPLNYYEYDKFLRSTNINKALKEIKPVLDGYKGTTALILITDGKNTAGLPPAKEAKALYDAFGDNLCLHFISMSDSADGDTNITELMKASGHGWDCGALATAKDLEDPDKMNAFLDKAFSAN